MRLCCKRPTRLCVREVACGRHLDAVTAWSREGSCIRPPNMSSLRTLRLSVHIDTAIPASNAHILCVLSSSCSQLHLAPRIAASCATPSVVAHFSVARRLDSRESRHVRRTPTRERGNLKLKIKSRKICGRKGREVPPVGCFRCVGAYRLSVLGLGAFDDAQEPLVAHSIRSVRYEADDVKREEGGPVEWGCRGGVEKVHGHDMCGRAEEDAT